MGRDMALLLARNGKVYYAGDGTRMGLQVSSHSGELLTKFMTRYLLLIPTGLFGFSLQSLDINGI